MSTTGNLQAITTTKASLKEFIQHHPIIAYFLLAFAGTWGVQVPILLGKNGLGLLGYTLPFPVFALLFIASTYAGPTMAGFVVTGATSGKAGIGRLLRRYIQWKVSVQWYLVALFGYLGVFLIAAMIVSASSTLHALGQNWPMIIVTYLPTLLTFNLIITLGEEPGWRGVALPMLQEKYGPLWGSVILGMLHMTWHLPSFFFVGAGIGTTFSFLTFGLFLVLGALMTTTWTWIYNNVGGSLLIMMLVHAANEQSSPFFTQLVPGLPQGYDLLSTILLIGVFVLVILLTRGRLSYKPQVGQAAEAALETQPAES
ncbi:MAG TPA: CPBP family intramembrane glutamic endopeptidase [Ktedonobacteraceae bacterium]|nr:CPBP family intramembrane glutamic endopeptidase [Ktedonobacteraceae bacterium]